MCARRSGLAFVSMHLLITAGERMRNVGRSLCYAKPVGHYIDLVNEGNF